MRTEVMYERSIMLKNIKNLESKDNMERIKFFVCKVLGSMIFAYIIPVINILIIVLLNAEADKSVFTLMNVLNIFLATNACYIASISSYYKLNDKYNLPASNIKNLGLIISVVTFAFSTYELQRGQYYIPIGAYNIATVVTSFFCIILTVFAQMERAEIEKRVEQSEVEKAQKLIEQSKNKKNFDLDGENFKV